MSRPSFVAALSIALLFVGWGTWRYVGSALTDNRGESIAELDGFESAFAELEAPVSTELSTSSLGSGNSRISTPDTTSGMATIGIPMSFSIADENVRQADVWLTGTIEDDEPKERMALPQRISGGPNESLILR